MVLLCLSSTEIDAILIIYDFGQSERSDGMFCDDIFGETPTGIRKTVSPMLYVFIFKYDLLVLISNYVSFRFCLQTKQIFS